MNHQNFNKPSSKMLGRFFIAVVVAFILFSLLTKKDQPTKEVSHASSIPSIAHYFQSIPTPALQTRQHHPVPASIPEKTIIVKIKKGDNLAKIFKKQGISPATLQKILSIKSAAKDLTELHPGQTIKLTISQDKQLQQLVYPDSERDLLVIFNNGNNLEVHHVTYDLDTEIKIAQGTIQNSLYLAGHKAGLTDKTIMQLADIYAWDFDMAKDLRPGDSFKVIYDAQYLEGKLHDTGNILAAQLTHDGKNYDAIRFTDPKGHSDYYTPQGYSLRKAFLRSPVKYTRISSQFSKARYHPILHKMRAHTGTDFAAPRGTPIKSTADGTIIFRGWKGGYGRAIMIKTGTKYTTLYGHMSRFAKQFKKGSHVKQGQIIGYVGSSGLATGPHVHYEFRIKGVPVNPMSVKLPQANPIAKQYKAAFEKQAQAYLTVLDKPVATTVASASSGG